MSETRYSHPSEPDGPSHGGRLGEETVQTQTASRHGEPSQSDVDADEVRAAQEEIHNLVQEISDLSRLNIPAAEFYGPMLDKVVQALAAIGGAVWTLAETGGLQLQHQINIRETRLPDDPVAQNQHGRLLTNVLGQSEGALIPPHSGVGSAAEGDENAAANPTDFLLILSPVHNDEGPQGVVEVFQRPGARISTQRGYLNFLEQMCEYAGDYLKAQRLRHFSDKQSLWEQLEAFTRTAHQTLDLRQTAFSIANEGRRLIGCDRVSVAIQRGGACKIECVSGQDSFDKRSNVVTMLNRLATAVTATGEDLWYTGDTSDLAPQVEEALDAYVDESHAKAIAVLPLVPPLLEEETAPDEDDAPPREVVGALIVEQMVDSRTPEGLAQRVEIVRQHSATAIANAQEHGGMFLMPLWKFIGKTRWLVRARTLPKTVAVTAALLLLTAWLCLWPADFTLEARGKLVPKVRKNVFAGVDGQVVDVMVDHDQKVNEGDLLVRLRNVTLEKELTVLQGRKSEAEKQYNNVLRMLGDRSQANILNEIELSGKAAELRATLESLDLEEKWLTEQRQMLEVTAPINGVVTSWKVRERLQGKRPVNRGQVLMEVADPTGEWELELMMPENRMGHIANAEAEALKNGEKLPVTFILATSPEDEHEGTIAEIETTAEVRGEEGNTVLIRVAFNQELLDAFAGLRPGAGVTAKVHCGTAPIGYVWLHDLIGWVRSKVLFRF